MNLKAFRVPLAVATAIAAFFFFTHRSPPQTVAPVQAQAPAPQTRARQAPVRKAPPPQASQAQTEQSDSTGSDSDSSNAGTFHGYDCTVDCSGHEAGYNWAEEKGITDRDECPIDPHNSQSFTEGCWAYADEQSGTDNEGDDSP
jgi:hypothetical protein